MHQTVFAIQIKLPIQSRQPTYLSSKVVEYYLGNYYLQEGKQAIMAKDQPIMPCAFLLSMLSITESIGQKYR